MPTRSYPNSGSGGGGGGGGWPAKPSPDDTNYWVRSTGNGVSNGASWERIRTANVLANFSVTPTKTIPNATLVFARGQQVSMPGGTVSYLGTPPAVTSAAYTVVMVGGAQAGDVNTVVPNAMVAPFTSFSAASGVVTREGTDLGADLQAQLRITADNGGGATIGNVTLTFTGTFYIGTGAAGQSSEAFIQGLATVVVSTSRVRNVALNFTGTQKAYYGEPKRMAGTPTFKDLATGFDVAFTKTAEVLVDNGFGFLETIDLYESDNPFSTDFTLQVT